jgi:pimeloyl-ACP methyl ester carboxylesterase
MSTSPTRSSERGLVDLVFVPGFISNIENYWDEPSFARWLLSLTRFARVIAFDKRGTGMSNRVDSLRNLTSKWMTSGP